MRALRQRLRDPILWLEIAQLLKTAAAAVGAWVVARIVVGPAEAFLAPWAALLTVHATVYRTLARGMQQAAATILGVLLGFAAGSTLGVNAGSLAVAMVAGLAAGTLPMLRAESTTTAATAIILLLTGISSDPSVLVQRLECSGIGIAAGLLINFLIWPPLRDRVAARRLDIVDDRIGELLADMACCLRDGGGDAEVDDWVERTRAIDGDIDRAWAAVEQARESGRLNMRHSAAKRVGASDDFEALLTRLEQAVAETRSMARTIRRGGTSSRAWTPRFRDAFLDLLERTGAAVTAADAQAIGPLVADVERTARAHGGATRPVHAALLINLRNILEAMHDVAGAQPVSASA